MWKEAEARHRKTTNNPVSRAGLEQTPYQEPAKSEMQYSRMNRGVQFEMGNRKNSSAIVFTPLHSAVGLFLTGTKALEVLAVNC